MRDIWGPWDDVQACAAAIPFVLDEGEFTLRDAEWTLIGLVCDKIDEAASTRTLGECQRIAQEIINLVRERT